MSKCRFKVSKSVEHPRNYNSCQAGFFCYGYYTAPYVLFQSYFYANFKESIRNCLSLFKFRLHTVRELSTPHPILLTGTPDIPGHKHNPASLPVPQTEDSLRPSWE